MATPSSSATSPSPPMAFLTHLSLASESPPPSSMDSDDSKKAVQKFLARAELSSVTRALRARLAQASTKAGNANPNISFRELDAQSPNAFSRLNAAKRKTPHYNYNPPGQNVPGAGTNTGQLRKGGLPIMGSPLGATPRANGSVGATTATTADANGGSRNATHSTLFTSILAPPPAKQARTILNANDPPRAAPIRPMPSPRTVTTTKVARSIAEGTRAHAKSRSLKKSPSSPDKRKEKASRKRRRPDGVDADGDVEMKAAAALTSLLQHHRPSVGSAASPRSSIDAASDAGSSYSQYTQPTPRMINPAASASSMASTSTIVAEPTTRSSTPPGSTTPRPAPTDNEAADLMLYLATSPSPMRNKDIRESYRVTPPKGRVLFPTAAESEDAASRGASSLQRGSGEAPSIGGDVPSPNGKPPTPGPAQLLPPPPLPSSPSFRKIHDASPRPAPGPDLFNEYINASPSPARPKANATLRAEVGRKLFEEEQMRLAMGGAAGPKSAEQQRPLSAGIDLVKS